MLKPSKGPIAEAASEAAGRKASVLIKTGALSGALSFPICPSFIRPAAGIMVPWTLDVLLATFSDDCWQNESCRSVRYNAASQDTRQTWLTDCCHQYNRLPIPLWGITAWHICTELGNSVFVLCLFFVMWEVLSTFVARDAVVTSSRIHCTGVQVGKGPQNWFYVLRMLERSRHDLVSTCLKNKLSFSVFRWHRSFFSLRCSK